MATIKPMALIESMSGKVCMHSDVYFRTNKRTGVVSSGKLCFPYKGEPSANQTAVRNLFASAVANAKSIVHATPTDTANYSKLQNYKTTYEANNSFGGTLYNFILKKEFQLLKENAD